MEEPRSLQHDVIGDRQDLSSGKRKSPLTAHPGVVENRKVESVLAAIRNRRPDQVQSTRLHIEVISLLQNALNPYFCGPAVDPRAQLNYLGRLEESTFLASDSLPPLNESRLSVNTKQPRPVHKPYPMPIPLPRIRQVQHP